MLCDSIFSFSQLLYEELKLDENLPGSKKMTMTAVSHQKSTSEAVLQQLKNVHPLPSVILEYRHVSDDFLY